MSDSFAFRQFGVSAAAVLALALSACGGGGGGGSAAELAAAPASAGGAAPADGDSAAAGAPSRAGEGGGESPPAESAPAEPEAGKAEPGVPVGEAPSAGAPAAPGGGSASLSAAVWHVFGEAGTGDGGDALVTAGDLAGVSTTALIYAASSGPDFGDHVSSPNYPTISQSDAWMARGRASAMEVRVGHNDAGQTSYGLNYREEGTGSLWALDSEAAGANVRRLGSGSRQGALLRREDSAGNLWAAVTTDISGPGDTDWLATGVWAYAPAQAPSEGRDDSRGYRFGVFADGGDPFRAYAVVRREDGYLVRRIIGGMAGAARYEGDASGVYSRRTGATEATRRNDLFAADATLTINFDVYGRSAAAGRIHNIAIDGTPIAGNPEIILGKGREKGVWVSTSIGTESLEGWGYEASASITFDGVSRDGWDGDWGAAFFGNPAPGATGADRLPGSIAGTFGVADGTWWRSDGDVFIGAFGAHRTGWTPEP